MRYPIVCFCGSTRFKEQHDWQAALWKTRGFIVLGSTVFGHSIPEHAALLQGDMKQKLDSIHLAQIDLANIVFVLNVDGYIGQSTSNEIAYAMSKNKTIEYLQPIR